MERDLDYFKIACDRISAAHIKPVQPPQSDLLAAAWNQYRLILSAANGERLF